ncbi:COX15/CtaA family protein [Flavobacterium sp.]|uniref:COX15/CtaA family protein n=1 Tax=Flavobacterium sp. TaxID=239 RepID=UPI0025CC02CC|nr:COX15/CtaA family protein [Flavobacterium sp.]
MKKYFLTSAKISLVLVYFVIFAGAFVRLTGSGMGCPDWPKCFGYYIPPTEKQELLFTSGKKYEKGQVIIKDETLLVVKKDFVAKTNFDTINWEKYTKHDYAIFNPLHTWVEYINRLLGALAGLFCLLTFFLSITYWQERKKLVLLAFLVCVLMSFQAWLGKTVVDSVLSPVKITVHMLAALVIITFQLYLTYTVQSKKTIASVNSKLYKILLFAITLTLTQILMGTGVREHVDTIAETGAPKVLWLQNPTILFYIHRSFSILVLLTNLYLFVQNRKLHLGLKKINGILILIVAEIVTGILMYYLNFPFGSQTIHVVIATLLFGLQFYMILENKEKKLLN